MISRRLALGAVAALCATATVPAHAATKPKPKPKPKPVCNLVTDVADDAGAFNHAAGAPTNDASLDILSADVATNATQFGMVIRVKHLMKSNTMSPLGQRWTLRFNIGLTPVGYTVTTGPIGTSSPRAATVAKIDDATSEIRVTIPLKELPDRVVAGKTVFRNLYAETAAVISYDREALGTSDSTTVAPTDHADTTKTYLAGTPSCVKIGQ